MQRRRQVERDASQQMESLRRHRAEKDAARQMAQGAQSHTFRMQLGDPWELHERAVDSNDASIVAAHEEQWATIDQTLAAAAASSDSSSISSLSASKLPWPPFDGDMERYLKALAAYQAADGGNLRKAYTRSCLRWHPDKFQHKFGRLIAEDEFPLVMEKVQKVSQRLTTAWGQIQYQGDAS